MTMATTIQTDVPLVNVPFVDPRTGNVTEAWFLFLIQLWRRTGGNSGTTPDSLTIGDVLALEETFSQSVSASDTGSPLTSQVTFAPGSQEAALLEMIFAPVGSSSAGSPGSVADQTFTSVTDFNPGVTTSLALANTFSNAQQLWVFFDGTFQGDDQYSLSGTTLTFTSAIPDGVSKVYVKGLR
ncbi:parallel beta-helix repeat-containing protein [Burkholderia multivorans]|uniref:Parallel beta-helix repeat-containing protein n=1 Tax=Burkholderia multivorans TaxID=87883 RepID=A0ABD7L6L6_9BURK|nr:hypothetical protein [Burkholderia multivorans]SAJ96530.1 parallel beta-helix repeat-containing protein [Burkholderia multivorans]